MAAATPTAAAITSPYSTIYAFGDSLSDAGNDYSVSAGMLPVSPPYSDGRFSNGPVWVQDLATDLNLSAKPSLGGGTDFAYGGAYTGSVPGHAAAPNDLPDELTQFKIEDPNPSASALATVWIGSNDVISFEGQGVGALASVDAAVGNEMTFLSGLAADGIRNMLVLNVPDIGKTPDSLAAGPAEQYAGTALSAYYDALLQANLVSWSITHPSVTLHTLNTFGLLDAAIADPSAYGFTNVTSPLWSGNYTDATSGALASTDPTAQAGYLFWDGLHPTQAAHALVANAALGALGLG